MALKLDRIPANYKIVTPDTGAATGVFQRWWQKTVEAIESAFAGLAENVSAILVAQAAADAAQTDVDATQTPSYLTLANTAILSSERAFVASGGLSGTDGGAGSTYTVALANIADQRVLANVSGGSAAPTATAFASILGIGSALKWATARTLTLGTDASGSVSFDGSAGFTLNVTNTGATGNFTVGGITRTAHLRVDETASASVTTISHTIPVSINGVTYYMMLSNAP